MRKQAIQIMKNQHGIVIDPETEMAAFSIIPWVFSNIILLDFSSDLLTHRSLALPVVSMILQH
jgi:hypothetical protein